MTKKELEKATGQELIEERDYCGVDGYYGDYLENVNAEMLKRFNRLSELEAQIEKMKCCENCRWEQPCSLCDDCKRLEGQIFSDTLTSDNWELRR